MKKFILATLLALLSIGLFSSCSNEEEDTYWGEEIPLYYEGPVYVLQAGQEGWLDVIIPERYADKFQEYASVQYCVEDNGELTSGFTPYPCPVIEGYIIENKVIQAHRIYIKLFTKSQEGQRVEYKRITSNRTATTKLQRTNKEATDMNIPVQVWWNGASRFDLEPTWDGQSVINSDIQ